MHCSRYDSLSNKSKEEKVDDLKWKDKSNRKVMGKSEKKEEKKARVESKRKQ